MKLANFFLATDKYETIYKREVLSKPKKQMELYILLTIAVLVGFGVFGIRPTLRALLQKNRYTGELKDLKEGLESKKELLIESEKTLANMESQIDILNQVMPKTDDTEDYLTNFVQACAQNGYIVTTFHATKRNDEIEIRTKLTGSYTNISQLMIDLEKSDRITYIERVGGSTNKKRTEPKVTVDLKIFLFDKKSL